MLIAAFAISLSVLLNAYVLTVCTVLTVARVP